MSFRSKWIRKRKREIHSALERTVLLPKILMHRSLSTQTVPTRAFLKVLLQVMMKRRSLKVPQRSKSARRKHPRLSGGLKVSVVIQLWLLTHFWMRSPRSSFEFENIWLLNFEQSYFSAHLVIPCNISFREMAEIYFWSSLSQRVSYKF